MPVVRKGRYSPAVHMIKLTETRKITPYKWVHPGGEGGPRLAKCDNEHRAQQQKAGRN
jgi:hypothetical protein